VGADRSALIRRGLWLNYLSLGYNAVEAIVSLSAGLVAGSVALVGFGIDSAIEVTSAGAAQWRLRADHDQMCRSRVERRTLQVIGGAFLVLAAYVAVDGALALWRREAPDKSVLGMTILVLSIIVMPLLARAKRRVALAMGSGALAADAMQTSLCAWLSAIALAGVGLNALAGWWWADPVAALAMVPIIAREGVQAVRGESSCADCDCA
jgi:divalent metal cation (Fe/Co/Zn/Cd) transporter